MVCSNMANLLQLYRGEALEEIESYYEEAIAVLEDRYRNSAKLKGDKSIASLLADVNYNYWIHMLSDNKYEGKCKKIRKDAMHYWQKAESVMDANISYYMENSRRDEMCRSSSDNYSLVFYVQGGARKKKIQSKDFIFIKKEEKQPTC